MAPKEGLGQLALAGKRERAKTLAPWPLRHLRVGRDPLLEGLQVVLRDLAVSQPLDKVLFDTRWQRLSANPWHQEPKTSRTTSSRSRIDSAGSAATW